MLCGISSGNISIASSKVASDILGTKNFNLVIYLYPGCTVQDIQFSGAINFSGVTVKLETLLI